MRVQCSTCLELLAPGDDLTCTPCGHVFHMACVIQWFETKKNCPQVTSSTSTPTRTSTSTSPSVATLPERTSCGESSWPRRTGTVRRTPATSPTSWTAPGSSSG